MQPQWIFLLNLANSDDDFSLIQAASKSEVGLNGSLLNKNDMKLMCIGHSSEVLLHAGSDLKTKIKKAEYGFLVFEIWNFLNYGGFSHIYI